MRSARDYPQIAAQALARLRKAPSFRALPPDERRRLAHDTTKVATYLKGSRGESRPIADSAGSLVEDVDFPAFVEDLIKGTFDAVVDSSIQQMEAYADLLKDIAGSVDAYATDDDPADRARHRQKIAIALLSGIQRISRG